MSTERAAAQCVALGKTYFTESAEVRALVGVDAEFPHAALTAVVGPSGSGKSSLLRILAALEPPTSGSVLVRGHDLSRFPESRLRRIRRREVGYVFQRPSDNFVSYLSLDEHVDLARASADGDVPEADELLDELGLSDRRGRLPRELSGGEQQRAAFACALMSGPRIIVADEPTAELDSVSSEDLLRVVRRLVERGVALVIATHDHGVMRRADEGLELDHGRVKSDVVGAPSSAVRADPVRADAEVVREPLLEVERVTKTYRRGPEQIHAVEDASLRLHSGQLVGVMGRSGSGKTTLLNIIIGWERPDSGDVRVLAEGTGATPGDLLWTDLAVVPQKFGLVEELTVRENVVYPARLAGADGMGAHVDELLATLGLDELADRYPTETSVGQQQRAALARALVLSPRLLVADEPTGHQDAGWATAVFEALRVAAARGTCCLVATHNEEATPYLDVVDSMANGRLRQA